MMKEDDDGSGGGRGTSAARPSATNNNSSTQQQGGPMNKVGFCCFKFKEQTQISALEFKIANRQKKFGVDYLTLVERKAPQAALKECLKEAMKEINELQAQINDHYDSIEEKKQGLGGKTDDNNNGGGGAARSAPTPAKAKPTNKPSASGTADKSPPTKTKSGTKKKKKGGETKADNRFSIDDE